jgi:hypothetical protein
MHNRSCIRYQALKRAAETKGYGPTLNLGSNRSFTMDSEKSTGEGFVFTCCSTMSTFCSRMLLISDWTPAIFCDLRGRGGEDSTETASYLLAEMAAVPSQISAECVFDKAIYV